MINIYTIKKESEDWIFQNDWYFNLYTSNEEFTEKEKRIIQQIDNAKLTDDNHIQTKYGLGTIRNLSSGCKTILNVLKYPEKVVNADECGKNVLDMLFEIDNINIYMSRPERIDISADKKMCFNDKDIVIGRTGYEKWWSQEYERKMLYDL